SPTATPTPLPTATPTRTATATQTPTSQATPTPTPVDLVGNPGFETNTSGWNASGTGVTVQRVPGGHTGGYSAKLTNGNATNDTCTLNDSPNWVATTFAGTYTGGIWVRAD